MDILVCIIQKTIGMVISAANKNEKSWIEVAVVTPDHTAWEMKIAMLEDDIDDLKMELLLAYAEIERAQNPFTYIIGNLLNGGEQFEFKYKPEELGTVDS